MAAELGLPTLIIFLCIVFFSIKIGFKNLSISGEQHGFINGLIYGLSTYLITMITGHPLLLPNQQFIFWFIIANLSMVGSSSDSTKYSILKFSKYSILATAVIVTFIIAGYFYDISLRNKKLHGYEYGYYHYENWIGEKVRWTWCRAASRIKATGNILRMKVFSSSINSKEPDGLNLKLFLNEKLLDEVHLFGEESRNLYYYVPSIRNKNIELRAEVNQVFNPRNMGLSEDPRTLGIAMTPISFLKIMPLEGIGFRRWKVR